MGPPRNLRPLCGKGHGWTTTDYTPGVPLHPAQGIISFSFFPGLGKESQTGCIFRLLSLHCHRALSTVSRLALDGPRGVRVSSAHSMRVAGAEDSTALLMIPEAVRERVEAFQVFSTAALLLSSKMKQNHGASQATSREPTTCSFVRYPGLKMEEICLLTGRGRPIEDKFEYNLALWSRFSYERTTCPQEDLKRDPVHTRGCCACPAVFHIYIYTCELCDSGVSTSHKVKWFAFAGGNLP